MLVKRLSFRFFVLLKKGTLRSLLPVWSIVRKFNGQNVQHVKFCSQWTPAFASNSEIVSIVALTFTQKIGVRQHWHHVKALTQMETHSNMNVTQRWLAASSATQNPTQKPVYHWIHLIKEEGDGEGVSAKKIVNPDAIVFSAVFHHVICFADFSISRCLFLSAS